MAALSLGSITCLRIANNSLQEFHFYGRCNKHELISECANDKKEKITDCGGVK